MQRAGAALSNTATGRHLAALPALKTGGDTTGRPTKDGLDYFRHDIGLMSDPKLITARRKYGAAAIVVYLQLLVMAYRDKGYYLAYGDSDRDGVIWSIKSEVLSGRYEPDAEKIAEMIDCLAAHGFFDGDLFQQGIITSHRIQEHYYFATAGRTNPEVKWELWLLTEQEMREISSRSVLLQKFISHEGNPSFTSEKPQFPSDESTHSKVKEKDRNIDSNSTLLHSDVEGILGERLNKANRSAIAKMRSLGMTDEVITATAHYAVGHAKSDSRGYVPYFMTVLRERLKNGVLTAADLSRPKEQSRPKQEAPSGYLSPTNISGSDWEQDWKAQKDAIREQRRQVEEQQDDSQLSDWERAWRDRVMNRSKENTND